METKKERNKTFALLSAFGIIFVVAGHADFGIFDVAGLFPYYAFHVPLFVFISGYFYKEESEQAIGLFLEKKAKRLLLPYFLWNLFYGILVTLLGKLGFAFGQPLSFKTLIFDPIVGGGHQFGLNFAAWFVPILFIIEVLYLVIHKLTKWLGTYQDWILSVGTLTVGILTVYAAIGGHVWGYYKFPGRILFLLPAFAWGYLYKKKLEQKDILPTIWYMFILFLVQYLISLSGKGMAYSAVWCTGFAGGPFLPYITTFTGIAFWLRIAKILSGAVPQDGILDTISRHTYSIMLHHITGFFILKSFFFFASQRGWILDFNKMAYFQDYAYAYLPKGIEAVKWLYLLIGLGFPILVDYVGSLLKKVPKRT